MLDARRLRVLCAVADHPTLSAAADALSYTPSAVSQQIVALEREIGVRVLHRGPRGVRLTAAGQLLVEQARPILSGLQAAEASVIALDGLSRGRLALASFATVGATILPRAIAGFRARHPEVTITLTQADPQAAMARLRAGEVDLILTADAEQSPDGVEVVTLLEDPLHAVLPGAHPLAGREQIGLEELASETWVDTPSGVGRPAAAAGGVRPRRLHPARRVRERRVPHDPAARGGGRRRRARPPARAALLLAARNHRGAARRAGGAPRDGRVARGRVPRAGGGCDARGPVRGRGRRQRGGMKRAQPAAGVT